MRSGWVSRCPSLIAAFMILFLSGCGPELPQAVGVIEKPADVLFGAQHQPPKAPLTLIPNAEPIPPLLGLGPPFFVQPDKGPANIPRTDLRHPQPACPPAPANAVPAPFSPVLPLGTPHGTYAYRSERAVKVGSNPEVRSTDTQERSVQPVLFPASSNGTPAARYYYGLATSAPDGSRITTTYWPRPDTFPSSGVGGLYLISIVVESADRQTTSTFQPNGTEGVRLMLFPAKPTDVPDQQEVAVDPLTGTAVSITHQTLERPSPTNGVLRVDACGKLVDTWDVHVVGTIKLAQPSAVFKGTFIHLDAIYGVATQYGALIVGDQVRYQALDPSDPTGATLATGQNADDQRTTDLINSVPSPPCDPAKLSYTGPVFSCEPPTS